MQVHVSVIQKVFQVHSYCTMYTVYSSGIHALLWECIVDYYPLRARMREAGLE